MIRRRFHAVALFVLAAAIIPTTLAQHPNIDRGFQADKVYQLGMNDSVNLYNGNLTLTIPIGNEYQGGGMLRYGLHLSYNSKNWDYEIQTYNCPVGTPGSPPWCGQDYKKAVPSRRSNAGMGWLLSLGRFPVSDTPPEQGPWHIYESPDGADHVVLFDSPDATVGYTNDGSFLRVTKLGNFARVEFPDGMVHTFTQFDTVNGWRVTQIADPFGNRLDIDYEDLLWTLKEYTAGQVSTDPPVRTHYVHLKSTVDTSLEPSNASANYKVIVSKIDLASFDSGRAVYEFDYGLVADDVKYACYADFRDAETPDPLVPRLKAIVLPDQSKWSMEYFDGSTPAESFCAAISKLTLPTGGEYRWTYNTYVAPTESCNDNPEPTVEGAPFTQTEGVGTKTLFDPVSSTTSQWTYTQSLDQSPGAYVQCYGVLGSTVPKSPWSKVTVSAPDSTRSEHWFSLFQSFALGGEYGLPFTRTLEGEECPAGGDLCLSSRESVCLGGNCTAKRSHYVRYEGERREAMDLPDPPQNRREVQRQTVFHDDGDAHTDIARKQYDGLGNYRSIKTSDSWTSSVKSVRTNFNPGLPDILVDPETWASSQLDPRPSLVHWQLRLFDRKTVTDDTTFLNSELDFNDVTGFLERRRDLTRTDVAFDGTNTAREPTDTVVTYDYAAEDQQTTERYYGGDGNRSSGESRSVLEGKLDTIELGTPEFQIEHHEAYGTRSLTKYQTPGSEDVLTVLNVSVDANTGIPSSTFDVADLETTLEYDDHGRIEALLPSGRSSTTYEYDLALKQAKNVTAKK